MGRGNIRHPLVPQLRILHLGADGTDPIHPGWRRGTKVRHHIIKSWIRGHARRQQSQLLLPDCFWASWLVLERRGLL